MKQLKNLNTAPSSKLLYHRLDLLGQPSSCLHFKQLATVGKKNSTSTMLHQYVMTQTPQTFFFLSILSSKTLIQPTSLTVHFSLSVPFSESPTVMLAAGSFSSPYEHLSQPETKRMVEHYTAYLSDNTRLIANPGLKVRSHTCMKAHTLQHKG